MTKIARATQKVFGDDVVAQDQHCVFGSLKAGTASYSKDPATIQSLAAWGLGWKGATVNNQAPVLQDLNALCYLLTRQIAYGFQMGVPEWDSGTEYHQYSVCQSSGVWYISLQNTNLNHAVTDASWWEPLLAGVAPGVVSSSTSGTVGTSTRAARQDHSHNLGAHAHTDAASGGLTLYNPTQTGASIDAATGNAFVQNGSGTRTITLTNLSDGQCISVVVQGASGNVISWTTAGLTQKTSPIYSNTMLSTLSFYSIQRLGSNVYISVSHGY